MIFFAFAKSDIALASSDIVRLRLTVIFYSPGNSRCSLREPRISLGVSRISLRSNRTRREANRTGVILRQEYHAKNEVLFFVVNSVYPLSFIIVTDVKGKSVRFSESGF